MEVCQEEPANTDDDLICSVLPLFILHRKSVPAQDAFLTVVRSLPADQLLPAEAKIENIVDRHEIKCDSDCEFSLKLVQTRSDRDLNIVDVVSACSENECADELDTCSLPSSDGHSSDTIIESSAPNADHCLTGQPIDSDGLKANSPSKPSVNLIDLRRKPVVLLRRIDPSVYQLYTASNGTSKSHDGSTQSVTFDSTIKSNSKTNVDFHGTTSSKNLHVFWQRSEDKLYHCTECPSSFVTSKAIRTHVLSLHKSLAPYECRDCGQSFIQLKMLNRHITRVHCTDNPNFCAICVKLFFSASTLNQHMQHRHPEHAKPKLNTNGSTHNRHSQNENSCPAFVDCKQSFTTEAAINSHVCTAASHVGNAFSRDNVMCKAEVDINGKLFCREQIGDHRIRQQLWKCPVCDQCFGKEFVLKRHVAKVHAKNCANVCSACGRRFISSRRLKQHLLYCRAQGGDVRISTKTGPERKNRAAAVQLVSKYNSSGSPGCQSNSDTTEYLSSHEDATEKQIDNATCDKMSASSTLVDLHNSESASHQCPVCHQTFASASICGEHILTAHRTDKESLKCPLCDQCFMVESTLKHHCANVHANGSKNVCSACGKLFHSQQILKQHLLDCCAVQKQFATCHMCGIHCDTATLRDHICSPVSSSQNEDYFCYDCKQGFALFESFSNHKCAAEVSPHGQVSCDGTTCESVVSGLPESISSSGELHDCHSVTVGANDYSDSALRGLDNSSDTDKSGKLVAASKFKCADCPTLCFSMKKALSDKRTVNVHASCALLQCSVCSASFTEQMKYNRHMIIHSADNPNICDICNKGLISSNMLIRHRIYKHGIKNVDYVCDQCGKRFPTPRSLKGHFCLNPSRQGSGNERNVEAEMHHSVENSILASKKPMPAASDTAAKKYPQCNECGQLFLDYRRLGLHRLSKHGADRNLHQCSQCHHNYANRKQLRVHVKLFHVSCAPYLCPDCNEHFRTASLLIRHMKIHSTSNPNVCDMCNKGFFSARSLKTHMIYRHKLSSSKHSHKCKICGDIFNTVMDLSFHLKLHRSKGMFFFCDKCSVSFSSHLAFNKHLCASAGSGYFMLGDHDSNMFCGSTGGPQHFHNVTVEANANSDSALHGLEKSTNIRVGHIPHERGKPVAISKFKCADCPTLCFGRKKALNKHMMDAHLLRAPFRCSVCNASYTDQLKYNRHMIIHSADNPITCDICNRGFSSSTRLIRHKIDKHGMKSVDYVCDRCGKKFSTPKSLKGHFCLNSSSHCSDNKGNVVTENHHSVENSNLSSDKPMLADDDISAKKYPQCNVCGQLFLDYQRLIVHRFSKHGTDGNLLQCSECHHNYANRRQLVKHIKHFHLSFAPYVCSDCNDRFRTAPLLVRHIMRIHSAYNTNVCSVCNKGFFSARTLKIHMIHRHKSQSSKHSHKCKICGDIFDTAMHLSIHLRSHRSKERTEDQMFFFCDNCNVGFSSRLALDKHLCASTCATALLGDHKSKTLCGSNEGDISKNANAAHLNGTVQNPVCEVENNAVSSVKLAATASSSYPQCYDCGKFFMHLHSLKKHLISQHMHKKVFECGLCQKAYFGIRGLNRHMQSLHKTSLPYCCPDCDKSFYYAQAMKRHMMTHSAGYPYSCTVCKKGFIFERQFKEHMKCHNRELMSQFECQICRRKFHSNVSLSGHLLCHRGVRKKPKKIHVNKRFACQVCCRTFSCNLRLQDHYCPGGRTYKLVCETCGEEFANRDSFESHGLRHLPKIYACDHCGRKYQSLERLNTHKRQAHMSHNRTFVCSVCTKSFPFHSSLILHRAIHEEPKITCEECGKQFHQLGQLTSHMRTHTGVKPYHCTYCSKAFSQHDRQLSHERAVHTLERPFKCSDCGKAFATGTEVKDHSIVMHSGIKAFACDICDRKFALNRAMTRHKKNVHQKAGRLREPQM